MESTPIGALHEPVLADRCAELLAPALRGPDAVAVDGTLGMGGHSEVLLRRHPGLRVIGIDRDPDALALATQRLAPFGNRFKAVHAVYDRIGEVVDQQAGGQVHAVLFDLGVSSLQLDRSERGFSYAQDAPLDMRMDQSSGPTAADLLQQQDEAGLRHILSTYGQERFAGRIAAAIVRRRRSEPIRRSGELVDLVRAAIPQAARRTGGNPAKRTFQALRIAVNTELDSLRAALPAAVDSLAVGGRMVVLSYHSLEDRLVKDTFRAGTEASTPIDLPTELPDHEPYLRALTRGSETAGEAEQTVNPRSASVRLRAVERIRPTPAHRRGEVT